MIRKIFLFLCLTGILMACNQASNEVKVINLFESGKQYVDQEITVTGTVMHICKHGGKKLFIAGKDLNKLVQVTTGPGIEKFESDLEGEEVSIKGVVKKMVISHPQSASLGEQEKKHCDTESKTACAEDELYYVECNSFIIKE